MNGRIEREFLFLFSLRRAAEGVRAGRKFRAGRAHKMEATNVSLHHHEHGDTA